MTTRGLRATTGTAVPPSGGLPESTQLLSPTGWGRAGDCRPGDLLVGADGQPTRVLDIGREVAGPVAALRIADGSTISAGLNMLWEVEHGKGRQRQRRTLTTAELQPLAARKVGLRLVRSAPVAMPGSRELPIASYLLGALVADGSFSSGTSVKLWTIEPEIRAHAEAALPVGARFSDSPTRHPGCVGWGIVGEVRAPGRNPVLNGLRDLQLAGRLSYDKFIPQQYLWASVQERVELLHGLFDCDGAACPAGQVSYSTSSARLAQDVVFLVRSLGGRCTLHVRTGVWYTSPTQCARKLARDCYKIGGVRIPGISPFRLSRKAVRVRPGECKTPQWTIKSVVDAGVQPMVSITVDSPTGLFLADGFIPVRSATGASSVMMAA